LLGFVGAASQQGHTFQVLSGSAETTMRRYGLVGVQRKSMGAVAAALDASDALVFPGGSIFQDVTSAASVGYYAKLVGMAKKRGKKVVLLGQGVGPLNTFFGKRWAAQAFSAADAVAVRDAESERTIRSLGCDRPVTLAADSAWLLPPQGKAGEAFGIASSKTVGLAPRPWGKGGHVADLFAETARGLSQRGFMPVFVEMDSVADAPLLVEIGKRLGGKAPEIKNLEHPRTVQQRMARMDAVIAMRLHAAVLAANEGVLPYLVSYDPKVAALAPALGLDAPVRVEGLTSTKLVEGFVAFMAQAPKLVRQLEARVAAQREAAVRNLEALERAFAG
jgi:polysaccharide pyruvyl transferase CsaB